MKVAILLLAAGRGTRLGADVPKAFLPLGPHPLLVHSASRLVRAVGDFGATCELLVLVGPDDEQHLAAHRATLAALLPNHARFEAVRGGDTRQESMENGLAATAKDSELVLVHDAARALVPPDRTTACIAKASEVGAALLAIPATDTLKRVQSERVVATIDRQPVWYAQTPQIARRELFLQAAEHARKTQFVATDDVSLLEHAGIDVAVVPGSTSNLKITRPDDLPLAEALLLRDPTPSPR